MFDAVTSLTERLDRFLGAALERQGLTIRAFAQQVGVTHVFVIRVRQGKALFPPEHFQRWCTALALDPAQRDAFLRLTLLARSPPEIRKLVASLERCVAQFTADQRSLGPQPRRLATSRPHPRE
jgi:transcriptional regulator with XRE-family HTH domain